MPSARLASLLANKALEEKKLLASRFCKISPASRFSIAKALASRLYKITI